MGGSVDILLKAGEAKKIRKTFSDIINTDKSILGPTYENESCDCWMDLRGRKLSLGYSFEKGVWFDAYEEE